MALSRVQSQASVHAAASATATPSMTFASAPTQGNLIVVVVGVNENAAAVSLVSAPAGYTQLAAPDSPKDQAGSMVQFYFWKIAGAGESATLTFQVSAAAAWWVAGAEYRDSAGGTWALDKKASNASGGTATATPDSGTTTTTTQANEVWVGALCNKNIDAQSNPTDGFVQIRNGGTSGSGSGDELAFGLYEKIVTATGQAHVAATIGTTKAWTGQIATFYAAAAPAGKTTVVAKLWNGTAVEASSEHVGASGDVVHLVVIGLVTVTAASETWKISARAPTASSKLRAATNPSQGANASRLQWVKIA